MVVKSICRYHAWPLWWQRVDLNKIDVGPRNPITFFWLTTDFPLKTTINFSSWKMIDLGIKYNGLGLVMIYSSHYHHFLRHHF